MMESTATRLWIGCAGWSLSSAVAESFPAEGSHLERYASVFPAVEINSCFYRPHRPATYARWRDAVPAGFRFSAKVPKAITHEARLQDTAPLLQKFIDEVGCLEEKLGCLLVQLPPSLTYDTEIVGRFFDTLRGMTEVPVVCEARHLSWFNEEVVRQLSDYGVTQVIADPAVANVPSVSLAAPSAGPLYVRLHGSPQMYHSAYSESYLDRLAERIAVQMEEGWQVWCVFDNTASGAAVPNALSLMGKCRALLPQLCGARPQEQPAGLMAWSG